MINYLLSKERLAKMTFLVLNRGKITFAHTIHHIPHFVESSDETLGFTWI